MKYLECVCGGEIETGVTIFERAKASEGGHEPSFACKTCGRLYSENGELLLNDTGGEVFYPGDAEMIF